MNIFDAGKRLVGGVAERSFEAVDRAVGRFEFLDEAVGAVGENLFRNNYHLEPVRPELLEQWKGEIDVIYHAICSGNIEEVRSIVGERVCDPSNDESLRLFLQGDEVTDCSFRLFAIGMFILSKKRARFDDFSTRVRKVVMGGDYSMEDFMDPNKMINCHDLSHLFEHVAKQLYGIQGKVEVTDFHRRFVAEGGEISDLIFSPGTGGLVFSGEDYLLWRIIEAKMKKL